MTLKHPRKPKAVPRSQGHKRMPADAVEAETFADIRRTSGRSEERRKLLGSWPITLAQLPPPWGKD
jgi:hypothetical protein